MSGRGNDPALTARRMMSAAGKIGGDRASGKPFRVTWVGRDGVSGHVDCTTHVVAQGVFQESMRDDRDRLCRLELEEFVGGKWVVRSQMTQTPEMRRAWLDAVGRQIGTK